MKIIYIITFPPKYEYVNGLGPDAEMYNPQGQLIGVWRADWGHIFARDVKRFYPEVQYEVWRPDYRADREYIHTFQDGVVHRSFPAQRVKYRVGLKLQDFWTSRELIDGLGKEIRVARMNEKKLLIHIPLDFSYLTYHLLRKFKNEVAFLHTSHLNPLLLKPQVNTLNPLKFLHRVLRRNLYKRHLGLLSEIAVGTDRIGFFEKNTRANVYQFDSLNFDFTWAREPLKKQEARHKLGLDADRFILFSSSRLVKEKQLEQLFLSLAEMKDLNFLCIVSGTGEADYENALKRVVSRLGLEDHIQFVGFLNSTLKDYYCASDVFISTSKSEAGPVSAIKAMALGIPVISTNTGIAAYLLQEYQAGMLIDKNDNRHWGAKIRQVLENPGTIGTINPDELEEDYGLEKNIKQLITCYQQSLINHHRTKPETIEFR